MRRRCVQPNTFCDVTRAQEYCNVISNSFLGERRLVTYLQINFWETTVL